CARETGSYFDYW
nr:immunoglobulin heavy chain junction region [Mus musculus]MBK4197376.1 immunoglobulin heavy chain junction region [Mus musculus]MBK4197377.1 immunoglobulin heavy chain junction region [Mus musculus]MBK4197378.1 immunoglobulin heavy chain junction region [Mus musculus]